MPILSRFQTGFRLIDGTDLNSAFGSPEILGGSATGTFNPAGNANLQVSATGISPTATGADNVLALYQLPANAFNTAGKGIYITAVGSLTTNANSKTIKVIYGCTTTTVGTTVSGGTTLATIGVASSSGGQGFQITAGVFKTGANASNTQVGFAVDAQSGAVASTLSAPSTSLTATESGVINIAVTGNAASATADIVLNALQIIAFN